MRLTKQLKAQVNSIKFASKIPTTNPSNNHHPSLTIPSTTTTTTTPATETSQPLISSNDNQPKIPTIITTSHSDNRLTIDKPKSTIKRYDFDDNDSLNSNCLQEEQIVL